MYKIILASHGSLATGMLDAVEAIAGKQENVMAFDLDHCGDPDQLYEAVNSRIDDNEWIILCDIKCGSIHNVLTHLLDKDNVKLITGMNLALILQIVLAQDLSESELDSMITQAQENIELFTGSKIKAYQSQKGDDELW